MVQVLCPISAPFPHGSRLGFIIRGPRKPCILSLSYSCFTVPHFNMQSKHGRSMAPRSRQVMLSCPSSLQGHSDFPTPITIFLPVSSDLKMLTTVRVLWRRWDLRSHTIFCHRMPMALLRVPCRCLHPLLPCKHWLSP